LQISLRNKFEGNHEKSYLTIAIASVVNIFSAKTTQNEAQWNFLRDELNI